MDKVSNEKKVKKAKPTFPDPNLDATIPEFSCFKIPDVRKFSMQLKPKIWTIFPKTYCEDDSNINTVSTSFITMTFLGESCLMG